MTQLEALTRFFASSLREVEEAIEQAGSPPYKENGRPEGLPGDLTQPRDVDSRLAMRVIPGDDLGVMVPSAALHPAVARLIERCGIHHLTTITAVDTGEGIELKYHFWHKHGLTLETTIPEDNLVIASVTDVLPGAAFYEREIHGMFGIDFCGHADLRPLLLPDAWQGEPPLRREANDG